MGYPYSYLSREAAVIEHGGGRILSPGTPGFDVLEGLVYRMTGALDNCGQPVGDEPVGCRIPGTRSVENSVRVAECSVGCLIQSIKIPYATYWGLRSMLQALSLLTRWWMDLPIIPMHSSSVASLQNNIGKWQKRWQKKSMSQRLCPAKLLKQI